MESDGSAAGRVVVVGSGVFGLSTACALRRRFLSSAHLDVHSRPSHCYSEVVLLESSSEAVSPLAASNDLNRIVRADYGDDALYTELAMKAIDGWHLFNARHSEAVYNECGVLLLTERDLESEQYEHSSFQEMLQRGVPVQRVRAADGSLAARFPLHAASGRYTDGYFNPRGGFVDSGRATQLLSEEAAQMGVDVRRGVHCVELVKSDFEKASLLTSAGELHAALIVMCCGAWTPSLIPYSSALLTPSAQPVVYLSPPPSLSSALSAASFPVTAASLSSSGFYFFPLSSRPLLSPSLSCGGRVVKVAHHGRGLAGRVDPSEPRNCPPGVAARVVSHIKAAMPILEQCELVAEKVCYYSDSADGDFLLDFHVAWRNVFICSGDRSDKQHSCSTLVGCLCAWWLRDLLPTVLCLCSLFAFGPYVDVPCVVCSGHAFKFLPVLGDVVVGVLSADKQFERYKQRFAWRASSKVTLDSCRSFADIE